MATYSVSARGAVTTAAVNQAIGVLWNPHASVRLRVIFATLNSSTTTTADVGFGFCRASARGTQTTTTTPVIGNSFTRGLAPASGATLDAAWSVQPTIEAQMFQWYFSTGVGSGRQGAYLSFPEPIVVPPVAGLAIVTRDAIAFSVCDTTFVWTE